MRFPKLSELDRDQAAIYNGAPVDGSVLISGPPGTGKTVIAFHRAHTLAQRKKNPHVIVFNRVLARYTGKRDKVAEDVKVTTLHQWAAAWWKKFEAGWPPTIGADRYAHDWAAIGAAAMRKLANGGASVVNWGHLIIDEGQDFAPSMYSVLRAVREIANHKGASPALAISVLADENQRLYPHRNATLDQIRESLGVGEAETLRLKKNYRNSKQIAELAACFYVGLKTGIPDLPTRSGPKPVVSVVDRDSHGKTLNAFVEKIARYARAHPTEEVGVIAMCDADRKSMFNRLSARLGGDDLEVQTYSSVDETDVADLTFDQPGRLTVLNYQSAKGLEFDAVFLIDPGYLLRSGGAAELNVRMVLYVASSRARSFLSLMFVEDEASAKVLAWLKGSIFDKEEL
jgi:DNA helicase II / ATP-dependent DNA helicase PcrA